MLHHSLRTNTINLRKLVNDKNIDLFEKIRMNGLIRDIQGLFQKACEDGHLQFAKWLWANYNNVIDVHADEENAFCYLCGCGNINNDQKMEFVEWLWSISNGTIDLHIDDEFFFKIACSDGNSELIKWLWDKTNGTIDITADNDSAFYASCLYKHINVAKWLSSLCSNYILIIEDDKIKKWYIRDPYSEALEKIKNGNYNEATADMGIGTEIIDNNEEICLICREEPEYIKNIIKLNCNHYYCLECILGYYCSIQTKNHKCLYCQQGIDWTKCTNYTKNIEK
jgi:hypothetical protein